MQVVALLALSVGLATDAMAVAVSRACMTARLKARHVAAVAVVFGGFQALMPLGGYLLGVRVGIVAAAWGRWVAGALLLAVGAHMLWEARRGEEADAPPAERDPFALPVLALLGVATSIDAFAAGIALPALGLPLGASLACIGATTALLSALGALFGRRLGATFGARAEHVGGAFLILLAVKLVAEVALD